MCSFIRYILLFNTSIYEIKLGYQKRGLRYKGLKLQ